MFMGFLYTPTYQGPLRSLGIPWTFIIEFYEARWAHFAGEHVACRFYCIKIPLQESEASSACLCVLPAWRTYAWTSASSGAPRALHPLPCTKCIMVRRSALHVVRCIPKKCIPYICGRLLRAAPTAFVLTRPLFQTVLSSLARVESVSGEM